MSRFLTRLQQLSFGKSRKDEPVRCYITGIAGVGKSTVAQQLKKRGVRSYDLDLVPNLCHWKNKATGKRANYYSGNWENMASSARADLQYGET